MTRDQAPSVSSLRGETSYTREYKQPRWVAPANALQRTRYFDVREHREIEVVAMRHDCNPSLSLTCTLIYSRRAGERHAILSFALIFSNREFFTSGSILIDSYSFIQNAANIENRRRFCQI